LRTLLDLLDTENEYLTARIDYTNAKYDRIYACYWLSETMGKLLETLKLELGYSMMLREIEPRNSKNVQLS